MQETKKKKGFTLVELLVVIAILGILAAVSVVGYLGFTEKANQSVDEQMCTQYNTLLKAARVEDDDIPLSDFIILIEENGINSNQFRTYSKKYAFAYNKNAFECVLIDKDSGQALYPKGATNAHPEDLWCVMDPGQRLQAGVLNYTLLASYKYVKPVNVNQEYTVDLNHNSYVINETPVPSIKLFNGSAVYNPARVSGVSSAVEGEEALEVLDATSTDWGGIYNDANSLSTGVKNAAVNGKVEGKKFFSSNENTININLSSVTGDNIRLTNCEFTGININVSDKESVAIEDCTFNNSPNYCVTTNPSAIAVTVKNNVFNNAKRGILLNLGRGTNIIEGNTFNQKKVLSNKGERKDHCIQIALPAEPTIFDKSGGETYSVYDDVKLIVRNNKVEKSQAFVEIHVTNVKSDLRYANAFLEWIKTPGNITFENNDIALAEYKILQDPGTIEDIDQAITDGKIEANTRQTRLDLMTEMVNAMAPLIK